MESFEIVEAAVGRDEEGDPKSLLTLTTQIYYTDDVDKEPTDLIDCSSIVTEINFSVMGDYTQVDLSFPSADDIDLQRFYRALETYHDSFNTSQPNEEPFNVLNVIPLSLGGEFIITCSNPIFWAVMPDMIGGISRNLRLLYLTEDILTLETDIDEDELRETVDLALQEHKKEEDESEEADAIRAEADQNL